MNNDEKKLAPGEFATFKSIGTTPTEQDLAYLTNKTFLSLWSYPNLWRDQRGSGRVTGDGKELCDLLVVFENHVIIFSDKAINYGHHSDPLVAWRRWYSKAIAESSDQIFGAERWIKKYPDRIFIDSQCSQRFPVPLPSSENIRFHRIAVARGAGSKCRDFFGGGTGSLMLVPQIIGNQHLCHPNSDGKKADNSFLSGPFNVGQVDLKRGFIHILDDATLTILMETLDTVQDFVDYLDAKERLITSDRLLVSAGDEELLAYYLKDINSDGKHDFIFPANSKLIIDIGQWESFQKHPMRLAQVKENECSYLWDHLIEEFSFHALNDSQYFTSGRGVTHIEPALRFLAREPRTRRRMLAQAVLGLVERTRIRDRLIEVRVVEPSTNGDPYYLFLVLRRPIGISYEEYRDNRRKTLMMYMQSLKVVRPQAINIIGIAFGSEDSKGDKSEDLLYIDTRLMSEEDLEIAKKVHHETGFLKKITTFQRSFNTYPDIPTHNHELQKGKDRNKPCYCGSGLKFKRCHG